MPRSAAPHPAPPGPSEPPGAPTPCQCQCGAVTPALVRATLVPVCRVAVSRSLELRSGHVRSSPLICCNRHRATATAPSTHRSPSLALPFSSVVCRHDCVSPPPCVATTMCRHGRVSARRSARLCRHDRLATTRACVLATHTHTHTHTHLCRLSPPCRSTLTSPRPHHRSAST